MSTINLLPKDYIQRRSRHRANVMCLVLFIVVMIGLGGAVLVSERSRTYTCQTLECINADYAEAAKLVEQMHRLEAQRQYMQIKAQKTVSLVERVPRSTILAVITNARPKNTSILKLKFETKKIVSAKSSVAAKSKFATVANSRSKKQAERVILMEITGLASTDVEVARFIANLAAHPLIQTVDLEFSKEERIKELEITMREFKILVVLKPKIDAMDALRQAQGGSPAPIATGSVNHRGESL